jgi:hypothetical protein
VVEVMRAAKKAGYVGAGFRSSQGRSRSRFGISGEYIGQGLRERRGQLVMTQPVVLDIERVPVDPRSCEQCTHAPAKPPPGV